MEGGKEGGMVGGGWKGRWDGRWRLERNTTNVKNIHLHRDSNPGPWNTVPML